MASIQDMLLAELIKIGDTIEFTFKGNTFTAKILRGGLIGKCQQQTLHEVVVGVDDMMVVEGEVDTLSEEETKKLISLCCCLLFLTTSIP